MCNGVRGLFAQAPSKLSKKGLRLVVGSGNVSLDILTPRGQVSYADEQKIAKWFNGRPGYQYIQTPKDKPAVVDALLIKNGNLIGIAETKCRYGVDLDCLRNNFGNEWLITWEKVRLGLHIAEQLCVPLYGFMYLVDDGTLLIQNISTAKQRREKTATQRTINGGQAIRENVFVCMESAKVYKSIF